MNKLSILPLILLTSLSSCAGGGATSSSSSSAVAKIPMSSLHSSFYGPVAHRGLHDNEAPENSLAAFRKAAEAGYAIELDVHLTKDEKLIIRHDTLLDNGLGYIESLTFDEIRNGYHLSNGEVLPSLDEAIQAVDGRVLMSIEAKCDHGVDVERFASVLKECLAKYPDPTVFAIISFDLSFLAELDDAPYPRGLLDSEDRGMFMSLYQNDSPHFEFYSLSLSLLGTEEVRTYRERGGIISGWTFANQEQLNLHKEHADSYTFENFIPKL